MTTIWKKVRGYEYYEISNTGKIRSLPRPMKRKNYMSGKVFYYSSREKILKPFLNQCGYPEVGLCKNGKSKKALVHRLLAEAFIPNPENKKQVNHKDGDKQNNKLENLEWVTPSENGLHAYKNGLSKAWHKGKTGSHTPSYRKTIQKDCRGNVIKVWDCALDAVREGGFDSGCISKCAKGISKTHKGYIWEYETN